jgi:hypothetical protein
MRKAVWTVSVDNYLPELTKHTFPSLQHWADKIGADFHIISERKYPEFPPTYEKLQIYELGKPYEWNILVDADLMIHPDMPDLTKQVPPDHVGYYMGFDASLLFAADQYFLRHGKKIGVATNFVVTHGMVHDFWTPLEFGWEIARTKTKREFIIDEYCVSRNLAKFGLKHTGLFDEKTMPLMVHFDITTEKPDWDSVLTKIEKLEKQWSSEKIFRTY